MGLKGGGGGVKGRRGGFKESANLGTRQMQKVVEIEVRYPRLHGRMRAKRRPHRRQARKGVGIRKKEVFWRPLL